MLPLVGIAVGYFAGPRALRALGNLPRPSFHSWGPDNSGRGYYVTWLGYGAEIWLEAKGGN